MKFKGSLAIHKPYELVAALYADPKHLKEYQDGFIRKVPVSGDAPEEGAISKLYYTFGKQEMELKETITKNELPNRLEAFYEHKHMDNTMICTFTPISEDQTTFEYEYEYTRMNWIMPKLMAILFPGMYKKQGDKWMKQFKEFVENYSE